MALDLSGALLEGIRVSEGNNPFTFPPRTIIINISQFNAVNSRAEYVLVADSTIVGKQSAEIADPDLRFSWTKNESTVQRFSYDSYGKRWLPSPGGPPDILGSLSNINRLVAPIPDPSIVDAPFALYVGSPVRSVTFNVQLVGTDGDFSNPSTIPLGTVQLAKSDGKLNFSSGDISLYGGQNVISQRQSFFDRTKVNGSFGSLPESSLVDYFLFMNPKPASGQKPLVRLDYGPYLIPIEVVDEPSLGSPAPGTFTWSRNTGRVRFSHTDVNFNAGLNAYYCGVAQGQVQLTRTTFGAIPAAFPAPAFTFASAIGITDYQQFIFFAERAGKPRIYFNITLVQSSALPSKRPAAGTIYLATDDGKVYFSSSDTSFFATWTIACVGSIASIEDGASIQFYRSGVNSSGQAQAPDFTIDYLVNDQILVDGLQQFPFVILPTTPVVDSTLTYVIDQGPSSNGTFTGILANGRNPNALGIGYLLQLDVHQLHICNRKKSQIVLQSATPSVKLADAAISESGLEVSKNGISLIPGVDFDFDANTGVLNFLKPIGEDDPNNRLGIPGVTSGNIFTSTVNAFLPTDGGKYIFIQTGPNQGLYFIDNYISATRVAVASPFPNAQSTIVDVRTSAEIIADRFWRDILPPLKKFTVAVGSSSSGPFTSLAVGTFNVFANTGQVNLSTPALPGQAFQITYVSLETEDNGATYFPINKIEFALFKIRQENASVVIGSTVAQFNPNGKTVNTARPIVAYLNGVPLDAASFEFEAPGVIRLSNPIVNGDSLVVDYWVEEATGGESSFNLLADKIDIDTSQITSGSTFTTFNGDQRAYIAAGSGLLVGGVDLLTVQSVNYDSSSDITIVNFDVPAVADSNGSIIQSCAPINGPYMVIETAQADIFISGTNAFSFAGKIPDYSIGTVIKIDGDPYYVINSSYDQANNRTTITISSTARRNYVIPIIIRSIRPVYNTGISFQTSLPADLNFAFTLIEMGNQNKVLIQGVDYQVANGGIITLTKPIGFGSILYSLYVSLEFQSAGTKFDINYAYAIAPDSLNGLLGQRLSSTYNLYAPDSFFYRVETVETYLPEVTALLKQSAQSGGSSGPNTANVTSMANKDFGRASPYFNEQNLGNVDEVVIRLLKFYNDLINTYEDILANLDGRVAGGNSGRFRFDGLKNNPPRALYSSITNDIDDRIKLYDKFALTGFFTFSKIPIYGTMATPNILSRIFPVALTVSAGLNDAVSAADFGQVIGTLGIENVKSVKTMTSAPARSILTSSFGTTVTIAKNGDPDNLIPRFVANQDIGLYSLDGSLVGSGTVVSATTTEPAVITLSFPVLIDVGSILQNTSSNSNNLNHFYVPGRDLSINSDTGEILNATVVSSPPLQNPVVGNEIVDAPLTFTNTDLKSKRIPVLDGLEQNDDGRLSLPILRYLNEGTLATREQLAYSYVKTARVSVDFIHVANTNLPVTVNDMVGFLNGPNAGQTRFVLAISSATSFTVSSPWPSIDLAGSDIVNLTRRPYIFDVLTEEIGVLNANIATPPASPALIGTVNSEIRSILAAIQNYGTTEFSGIGITTSNTLTDTGANFTLLGVQPGWLIFVESGPNIGLYEIIDVTSTILTIEVVDPYAPFVSIGSTTYSIIKPLTLLRGTNFGFASSFLRKTLAFFAATQTWQGSVTTAGIVGRDLTLLARAADISSFLDQISTMLVDEKLYDARYLWIDQRANRKTGTLTQQMQAASKRQDDITKLLEDQQKLLATESL